MKINNKEVKTNNWFAYDGCHKIYILEDEDDFVKAKGLEYTILPIGMIQEVYKNSCPLRFINNWKLNTVYVEQFEKAKFK